METLIKWTFKTAFWLAILVGIFAVVMNFFFVKVAVVGHNAMAPTMVAGDQVVIWTKSAPDFGDITICADPRANANRMVLGRVMGRAGFLLNTVREQLQINGQPVERDFQGTVRVNDTLNGTNLVLVKSIEKLGSTEHLVAERKGFKMAMRNVKVRRGLFLLSDNRSYIGEDSRTFGEVDPTTCMGKVFLRLKPAPDTGDEVKRGYLDWLR